MPFHTRGARKCLDSATHAILMAVPCFDADMDDLNDPERALIAGLLIGEGTLARTGRAQAVIGVHVRHTPLLSWRTRLFPRVPRYGPDPWQGRDFMRWMARGPGLVCALLPAIEPVLRTGIDPQALSRLEEMKVRAAANIAKVRERERGTAHYGPPREKLTVVR